jgi:hypothetical protein
MTAQEKVEMGDISSETLFLLDWLSREDFSQAGECEGRALDKLIELGLAKRGPGIHSATRGKEYDVVSVTDAGIAALKAKATHP